jgi:nitrate reductase delta subunit
MVDLLKLYEENGYSPIATELPDFLPLFLEYASTREPKDAIGLIGQPAHVVAALRERLAKRSSPYAAVMAALLALSRTRLDAATLAALRAEPDPEPDDLDALDAAWVDQEVTFGPGSAAAAGCPVDRMTNRLRAALPSPRLRGEKELHHGVAS